MVGVSVGSGVSVGMIVGVSVGMGVEVSVGNGVSVSVGSAVFVGGEVEVTADIVCAMYVLASCWALGPQALKNKDMVIRHKKDELNRCMSFPPPRNWFISQA